MIEPRLRKNLDITLIALALLIAALGIVALSSAAAGDAASYPRKQALWLILGLAAMAGASLVDHAALPRVSRLLYNTNLVLLLLVMRMGGSAKGATRWFRIGFFQFQPSELAKLVVIICLAVWISHRAERIRELPVLLGSLLYVAVPAGLILLQPDLGTSLVVFAIWFGMTFIAGARIKHLAAVFVVGIALFTAMWFSGALHSYQKNRLIAFVNPDIDPRKAGYHVRQARIAVGSGEVTGKGFGKGTQVQGGFVPENHTDFIYTVVAEEAGFVGAGLLALLYAALLLRAVSVMTLAEEGLGRLLCAGIVSMMGFHVLVNVGMNIGIMPVAGVPLPLFSYGGTSMLLNMACIGLLLGVGMRRHRLAF